MALDNTDLAEQGDRAAILLNPKSAFIVTGKCNYGCGEAYFVGGPLWSDDADDACIFRSYEAASAGMATARAEARGCMKEKGATMDIKPLAGYFK